MTPYTILKTYENIKIATQVFFEAIPQITKELREKHPELTDPSDNQKLRAELTRALPHSPASLESSR